MRHRKAGRKLNMDASARKAMFRNMVTSLLKHEQIRTTEARAKELRKYAERVISLGKRAPNADDMSSLSGDALQQAEAARVHAIRRARLWVNDSDAMHRLFGEYAERFASRPGGYTRVIKAGRRPGDNAAMAIIELVGEMDAASVEEVVEATPEAEIAPEVEDAVSSEDGEAAEEASSSEIEE
jgi:large subunit ribosomal protein L17